MSSLPVVAVPCNRADFTGTSIHFVRETYVDALIDIVKCQPILIPVTEKGFDLETLRGKIDGILLTGAVSNVCPVHYGAERAFREDHLDLARDATTLPLIRAAIAADMPLFAICRGFQEMNVALGGSLHQFVHEQPGMMDHRAPEDEPLLESYARQAHDVSVQDGGLFSRIGLPTRFTVNSIHQQGINRLAEGVFVEAIADDGLVEAISVPKKRFILGTQWHPEGDVLTNPASRAMLEEFGRAIRETR